MLVNGKVAHVTTTKEELEMSIFKFKKKEDSKENSIFSSYIELEEKAVPVGDILVACLNGKKLDLTGYTSKNDKQSYMAQDVDIVDINGKTVSIADLKACYKMKTENAKEEEMTYTDEEKQMKKKNEKDEEEKKKKEEEEAKNAKEEEEKKKAEDEAKKC